MRKHRFRGQDVNGWHYGDLQHRKTVLLHRVGITIENRGATVFYSCHPDSIGEGTGIMDINAEKASDTTKEIFEGDILRMPDRENFHSEIIGLVVYYNVSRHAANGISMTQFIVRKPVSSVISWITRSY